MEHDINHYWAKFEAIQDPLVFDRSEGLAAKRAAETDIASLVELIDKDISMRRDELSQLLAWASTFCSLQAQLSSDLGSHSKAISSYSKSLAFSYFYENAVRLIRALCEAGRTEEASSRVQELSDSGFSFELTNDPECATKLLHILGTYAEVADSAPRSVLVDVLKAVAKRGIDSLELRPFERG
jgi:pentatricopeptide repeat protein